MQGRSPPSPRVREPLLEHSIDVDAPDAFRPSLDESTTFHRTRSGTPGSLRLTVVQRGASGQLGQGEPGVGTPQYSLALRDGAKDGTDGVQEMEVEILTEAVVDAVSDAVAEVVQGAVQEAVQTAFEDSRFDLRANLYTLIAVTAAVLLERGVWNCWDWYFGDDTLASNAGSLVVGLTVLLIIRALNLPLVSTVPGR